MENKEQNEILEAKEILKPEEAIKKNEKLEVVLKIDNFDKMKKFIPKFGEFVETIITEVSVENKEEMIKVKANINKVKGQVATIRKNKKKELETELEDFSKLEKLLTSKYEEINKAIEKEEEEEVKNRIALFEEYYNSIKSGFPTFEFITFNTHFKIDKMKNKGNLTDGGDLTKKAKEYIGGKLEEYEEAFLALHDDPIAIEKYKDTLNVAESITYSKKIEELQNEKIKQAQIKEEEEQIEDKNKEVKESEKEFEKVFVKNTSNNSKKVEKEFVEFTVTVPKKFAKSFENQIIKFKMKYTKN